MQTQEGITMVDKYTKIILTIIAANLTLMTLKSFDLVQKAEAFGGIQKVAICDARDDRFCAEVSSTRGLEVYSN